MTSLPRIQFDSNGELFNVEGFRNSCRELRINSSSCIRERIVTDSEKSYYGNKRRRVQILFDRILNDLYRFVNFKDLKNLYEKHKVTFWVNIGLGQGDFRFALKIMKRVSKFFDVFLVGLVDEDRYDQMKNILKEEAYLALEKCVHIFCRESYRNTDSNKYITERTIHVITPQINDSDLTIAEQLLRSEQGRKVILIGEYSDTTRIMRKFLGDNSIQNRISAPIHNYLRMGVSQVDSGLVLPKKKKMENLDWNKITDNTVKAMIFGSSNCQEKVIKKFENENDFYFCYQNNDIVCHLMILITCLLSNKNVTLCIKTQDVLKLAKFLLKSDMLRDQGFKRISIKHRNFVNNKNFDLAGNGTRTLQILDIFPVCSKDFGLLMNMPRKNDIPFACVTGDQSFSEVIASGMPYMYSVEVHKFFFFLEFVSLACKKLSDTNLNFCKLLKEMSMFNIYNCDCSRMNNTPRDLVIDKTLKILFPNTTQLKLKQVKELTPEKQAMYIVKLLKKSDCQRGFSEMANIVHREYDFFTNFDNVIKREMIFSLFPRLRSADSKIRNMVAQSGNVLGVYKNITQTCKKSSVKKCNECEKTKDQVKEIRACAGCWSAFYCSQKCQRKAWLEHKKDCSFEKKLRKFTRVLNKIASV